MFFFDSCRGVPGKPFWLKKIPKVLECFVCISRKWRLVIINLVSLTLLELSLENSLF